MWEYEDSVINSLSRDIHCHALQTLYIHTLFINTHNMHSKCQVFLTPKHLIGIVGLFNKDTKNEYFIFGVDTVSCKS